MPDARDVMVDAVEPLFFFGIPDTALESAIAVTDAILAALAADGWRVVRLDEFDETNYRHDTEQHYIITEEAKPRHSLRWGAVLACGCWTYKGVQPGQAVGGVGHCDVHGPQSITKCNVEETP